MRRHLISSILIFLALTVLTGLVYPLAVTGIAQVFFKDKAEGSLIYRGGRVAGSALIGQNFVSDDPESRKYLWGRLSATSPVPYNAASSAGSNLDTASSDWRSNRGRALTRRFLSEADPDNAAPPPADLVTASASGLDPHVSPAGAYYQAARIAGARSIPRKTVEAVIDRHTSKRLWGILGEPVVNVLEVNLELESYGTAESR